MKKSDPSSPRVVCFGEMLYDYLPNGRFPGGAPMNVALHLQQQGVATRFISSVGQDEDGDALLGYLAERGLPTYLIQIDEVYPTGKVLADVTQSDNVKYDILQPVAWDYIGMDEMLAEAVETADMFLYGSLAARDEVTRQTLNTLLSLASQSVFDVNLRAPHYTQKTVSSLLEQANMVKLNEEELAILAKWYFSAPPTEDTLYRLAETFALATVCLTKGAEGAVLLSDGQLWHQPGYPVKVVDTIGSGDAFLATLVRKLLQGDAPQECLRYGCAVGAYVASQPGATPLVDLQAIESMVNP